METRILADEVIQVLPGLDSQDLPVHETTRRLAPQSESVEEREDHEVEGSRQEEDLTGGELESEQRNRQEEGLQEEDAEGRRQKGKLHIPRPPEREDGNDRQHEGEDRFGREQDVLDRHHGDRPEPERNRT